MLPLWPYRRLSLAARSGGWMDVQVFGVHLLPSCSINRGETAGNTSSSNRGIALNSVKFCFMNLHTQWQAGNHFFSVSFTLGLWP